MCILPNCFVMKILFEKKRWNERYYYLEANMLKWMKYWYQLDEKNNVKILWEVSETLDIKKQSLSMGLVTGVLEVTQDWITHCVSWEISQFYLQKKFHTYFKGSLCDAIEWCVIWADCMIPDDNGASYFVTVKVIDGWLCSVKGLIFSLNVEEV